MMRHIPEWLAHLNTEEIIETRMMATWRFKIRLVVKNKK